MKRLLACVLLLVSLSACTGGASSPGRHNCSAGGEVCIEVRANEPISFGEPVNVTITVTSEKDISDLGMSLSHDVDVVVDEDQGWEKDSKDIAFFKGVASWVTAVEAKRSMTFKRTLYLPSREGLFYVLAGASTWNLDSTDEIRIYMTKEGGKVYLSGTSIPITEGPMPTLNAVERATGLAMPTETPFPTLTAFPTTETPPPEILGTTPYPPPPPPETPYP